eukprot:maker-scaffold124_size330879-snap-gene-1.25 protein:Tk01479 transcript:maker-scaffold124_size330879-snap-gene-1.25-mRNA-1 annotation:"protein tssc1"
MGVSDEEGLIYGLEFQCRALCAVAGDVDTSQFLVGTQSLKTRNQIHWLSLDEEGTHITKVIYDHDQGEVWDLAPNPEDPNLFISRYSAMDNQACQMKARLLSRDEEVPHSNVSGVQELKNLGCLNPQNGQDVTHVSWMPGSANQVMTLVGNQLNLHDISHIEADQCPTVASGQLEGKGQTNLSTGAWNPHQNCQQFATVNDFTLRGWDVRSMKQVWTLENPGQQLVRSLDFNPNKQYHMATAGDDGYVRYWDIRSPNKPLITRADHSHWIWSVKFNQFHDQLVLTSSSDCHVVLSCLASISSEPHGYLMEDDEKAGEELKTKAVLEDGVLKTFEDHEESVYCAVWSAADPWTFASLSYDGRLVINQVPRGVKFKILNLD